MKFHIPDSQKKTELPESEWIFFPKGSSEPLDWQWNHWLNYEYARSCEEMVAAVQQVRKHKIEERETGTLPTLLKVPRFAVYLARNYPKFPKTPWLQLSNEQHARRIEESGSNQAGNPFEEDIIKSYDVADFADDIATGEMNILRGQLRDEKYAVLEIDFTQNNKQIEKKFHDWLLGRRKALEKMFKDSNFLQFVKPSRERMNIGQRGNIRTYKSWFNNLAAYRLMRHYSGVYKKCGDATEEVLGKPLYHCVNNSKWLGAQKKAERLMKRFRVIWEHSYYPPFILKPEQYNETIFAPELSQPFVKRRKIKKNSPSDSCSD
jgi:hypothetical protein